MQTLVSRVESIAARRPGRIAIGEYGRQATYRQFWEQARAFAEMLRDHGMRPGDRVAVVLPNRIEAAVAVQLGFAGVDLSIESSKLTRVSGLLPLRLQYKQMMIKNKVLLE